MEDYDCKLQRGEIRSAPMGRWSSDPDTSQVTVVGSEPAQNREGKEQIQGFLLHV